MENTDTKTALVIGASGALGSAITRGLATKDYAIVPVGRRLDALQALADEIDPKQVLPVAADISELENVEQMVTDTIEKLGGAPIDVAIIAAGTHQQDDILGGPNADVIKTLDAMYAVHLKAYINVFQVLSRQMFKDGGGVIIFLTSHVVHNDFEKNMIYTILKTAAARAGEQYAHVFGPTVKYVEVRPGLMDTPGNRATFRDKPDDAFIPTEQLGDVVIKSLEPTENHSVVIVDKRTD